MCDLFDRFVYVNANSLSKELCSEMIQMFESDSNKYNGLTGSGYNPDVKCTTDISIMNNINKDDKWKRVCELLNKELIHNLDMYINNFEKKIGNRIKLFKNHILYIDCLLFQRYTQNIGKFMYHDDSRINWDMKSNRVLVFMWYLNDVDVGGETEFLGTYRIKPQVGKLVIFPAEWTFPHAGIMPESSDKYIVTGWVYQAQNIEECSSSNK